MRFYCNGCRLGWKVDEVVPVNIIYGLFYKFIGICMNFFLCKEDSKMSMNTDEKVVACTLTTDELRKRKAEALANLKSKVIARKELPYGVEYAFNGANSLIDDVVSFIKTERQCCSFFTFQLTVEDVQSNILLSITGPDTAKQFLCSELDL
jgi:hypothetical protein